MFLLTCSAPISIGLFSTTALVRKRSLVLSEPSKLQPGRRTTVLPNQRYSRDPISVTLQISPRYLRMTQTGCRSFRRCCDLSVPVWSALPCTCVPLVRVVGTLSRHGKQASKQPEIELPAYNYQAVTAPSKFSIAWLFRHPAICTIQSNSTSSANNLDLQAKQPTYE